METLPSHHWGVGPPAVRHYATVNPAALGLALAVGIASDLFEELGWTGFATPRLLARHGCLAAGLGLGVLWATWHIGPDVPGTAAEWSDL